MFSSKISILFRIILRKVGIIFIIKSFINKNKDYEDKFKNALIKNLKEGMIVFDIGANIGFYTKLFAEIVNKKGHVFAFEPSHESAKKINNLRLLFPNITLEENVVGEKEGNIKFSIDRNDPTSVANKVFSNRENISNYSKLDEKKMITIDSICKKYSIPNLIKIDVEGYELNVLKGASKTLLNNKLKHLFIEIHFSELQNMGQPFAPNKIKEILLKNGFKIKYLDYSHIHAMRD